MAPLYPGDQLDHYRIEELVARSGMASIFRGTDLRTSHPVAIKVPHPEAECDPAFFERFAREAKIGKEMSHPGVVKAVSDDRQITFTPTALCTVTSSPKTYSSECTMQLN